MATQLDCELQKQHLAAKEFQLLATKPFRTSKEKIRLSQLQQFLGIIEGNEHVVLVKEYENISLLKY